MGHMNVMANVPPLSERVGCSEHDAYQAGCFACFVRNGGGTD